MKEIVASVRAVLPTLSPELVDSVVQSLLDSGVETSRDLQYVEESELAMLKPIQCRKLLTAWKVSGK